MDGGGRDTFGSLVEVMFSRGVRGIGQRLNSYLLPGKLDRTLSHRNAWESILVETQRDLGEHLGLRVWSPEKPGGLTVLHPVSIELGEGDQDEKAQVLSGRVK